MNDLARCIELTGIRMRPLRCGDAVAWHAYLQDPVVAEFMSYPPMTLEAVQAMVERCRQGYRSATSCKWALASQADDVLIGTCGFIDWSPRLGWAELAYELAAPFWGRGFVACAVRASLAWVFDQEEFHRVHAFVMKGNLRSERVLERAHFTREGVLRGFRRVRGQPTDFTVFSLLRPEWGASVAGRPATR
jgi:RimJ/RimL family protein N-acetyltransferase